MGTSKTSRIELENVNHPGQVRACRRADIWRNETSIPEDLAKQATRVDGGGNRGTAYGPSARESFSRRGQGGLVAEGGSARSRGEGSRGAREGEAPALAQGGDVKALRGAGRCRAATAPIAASRCAAGGDRRAGPR